MEFTKIEREIENKLNEAHIWAFGVNLFMDGKGKYCVRFDIEWGDWKHDHMLADNLVADYLKKNSYEITRYEEEVTDEDGSDTYSATHYIYFEA